MGGSIFKHDGILGGIFPGFMWDPYPGDLNRCAQRRMGQCYFQQLKRYLLWASAKRT